jgi:hypothetical protein
MLLDAKLLISTARWVLHTRSWKLVSNSYRVCCRGSLTKVIINQLQISINKEGFPIFSFLMKCWKSGKLRKEAQQEYLIRHMSFPENWQRVVGVMKHGLSRGWGAYVPNEKRVDHHWIGLCVLIFWRVFYQTLHLCLLRINQVIGHLVSTNL